MLSTGDMVDLSWLSLEELREVSGEAIRQGRQVIACDV